jgi:hypothetical protein
MNMRTVFSLAILLLLPLAQSSAEQAYTWVDENGTTHFSETPPYDEATQAEQINLLPAPAAGNTSDDDFYSVVNQADRMEKNRLENEKLTAERSLTEAEAKKASAEAQAAQQTSSQQNTQEDTRYYPAYPYYMNDGRRPGYGNKPHPGKPGRPEHLPAHRPMTSLGN